MRGGGLLTFFPWRGWVYEEGGTYLWIYGMICLSDLVWKWEFFCILHMLTRSERLIILHNIKEYTSNNQRLGSAGDNDGRSKRFLLQRCAFSKFHLTDAQNTRDQITSERRSKCAWSKCVLCIPFILSGSPNECGLHTCDACVITTWRLGLRAPLVARN